MRPLFCGTRDPTQTPQTIFDRCTKICYYIRDMLFDKYTKICYYITNMLFDKFTKICYLKYKSSMPCFPTLLFGTK